MIADVAANAPFTCAVVRVHDGDGPLWCANGLKVRIAGVQAPDYEDAEPCRRPDARRANYTCDNAAADRSQQIVERLVLHQTLTCQPVGMSYARVVARCTLADGRSLSCAVIAAGAAVRWERYWRTYRMANAAELLEASAARRHAVAMRTTSNTATVRLYHLSEEDAAATTLFYGPMSEALAVAHQQLEDVQAGLWLATENDVVAFLDLDAG